MCTDGMWVRSLYLHLPSGNVFEMKCLYAERENAKRASCLNDNNILTTAAVWFTLLLCGLLFCFLFLFDIGTSEQGE